MVKFGDLLFAGLTSGAIYAVFALCLCTLFRVSGLLNIAIGDFAMLGALGTDFFVRIDGWNTALAIVIVLLLIAVFSYAYDFLVLRTALEGKRSQDAVTAVFFFTFALSFFLEGVALHLFGTDVHSAPTLWGGPSFDLGIHIQRAGILVIAVAILVGTAFVGYIRFSLNGKAMAACGENALGARIVGIRQPLFRRGMFVAMALLAALFGVIESPLTGFVYTSGGALGFTGLIAAAFAAFIRPGRAVVMGLGIGILESMIGGYISTQFQETILYALLVGVILVRPQIIGSIVPQAAN